MKILGLEIRKVKNSTNKAPYSMFQTTGIWHYSPGMTASQMLANATVNACVSIISDAVASLSCNVYKKGENGREKVTDLPLAGLLKRFPNENDTKFTFFQQIMSHLLLNGNAFIFTERDRNNNVISMTPLDPEKVKIKRDEDGSIYYVYQCDGNTYKYNTSAILHIPANRYNRLRGVAPMEYSTYPAQIGLQLDEYTYNYFDGGIHSKLLVKPNADFKGELTKETAQKLSEQLMAAYGGKENCQKPFIVNKGFDVSPLNLADNSSSQLAENRAFTEREIAKVFRVPMFMLGSEASKFTNMEQANTNFLQHTLTPWLVKIQEYLGKLIPSYLQDTYYVEFDTDTMIRADYNTRLNGEIKAFQSGLYTLNEIRDMENMPRVTDDYGDKHFVQAQYKELSDNESSGLQNDYNNDNSKDNEE